MTSPQNNFSPVPVLDFGDGGKLLRENRYSYLRANMIRTVGHVEEYLQHFLSFIALIQRYDNNSDLPQVLCAGDIQEI